MFTLQPHSFFHKVSHWIILLHRGLNESILFFDADYKETGWSKQGGEGRDAASDFLH